MRRTSFLLGSIALLSALALPAPARAQSVVPPDTSGVRSGRPYRGLFGGNVNDPSQLLTISGSVSASADNNILGALRTPETSVPTAPTTTPPAAGVFGGGAASAEYLLSHDRITVNAHASTTGRYVSQLEPSHVLASEGGGVNVQVHAFGDTTFTATGNVNRRPYFLFELLPIVDAASVPTSYLSDDLAISTTPVLLESAFGGVEHSIHFSRRTALELDYAYARTRISKRAFDYDSQRAGGVLRHSVTEGFAIRAGYHARSHRYPAGQEQRTALLNDIDAGVDYSKALGPTHRTMLSVASGATGVTAQGKTLYRAVGDAAVVREIGRSWHAGMSYSRRVGFVDTFDAPVQYDSAIADIGGLITRRLEFTLSARAAKGEVGLGTGRSYSAYVGSVGVTEALSRNLALGVSYVYAQYAFDAGIALPDTVVRQPQRQSVRVVLTAWAPLFNRARKHDAPR